MSDELYFGSRQKNNRRGQSEPYWEDPFDEHTDHPPLEDESFNETPKRRPLNVENLRRMMRERNPHGE